MAEDFVQVNNPVTLGKKLKTWTSSEGANTVHSEAVTLTRPDGTFDEMFPIAQTLGDGAPVVVGALAAQVLPANTARVSAIIQNTGTANIRVGTPAVTSTTGLRVAPGGSIAYQAPYIYTGAIFAIREGGSDSEAIGIEET